MSKIVYCWELGGGYGHIGAFLPVAYELLRRRHDVTLVIKDLDQIETLIGSDELTFLQAPTRPASVANLPPAMTYADILENTGYTQTSALLTRSKAWRNLFDLLQPDLLIMDHSPTALLAARTLNLPCTTFGVGFCLPPKLSPLPSLRPWLNTPEKQFVETEARVLKHINRVLVAFSCEPLTALHELFDVTEDFLCTLPELDPYERKDVDYLGPHFNIRAVEPIWPEGNEPKIFAYLNTGYTDLGNLLQQLNKLPYRCLVHVFGLSAQVLDQFRSAKLKFAPEPIDVFLAAEQADLYIGHAGNNTSAAMLLSGCPQLLLPCHLEQLLIARSLTELGTAVFTHAEGIQPDYGNLIKQVLSEKSYRENAQRLAKSYADFEQSKSKTKIADRCETILAKL